MSPTEQAWTELLRAADAISTTRKLPDTTTAAVAKLRAASQFRSALDRWFSITRPEAA